MNTYLNVALALIAGVVVGALVNISFVMLGPLVIAPPAGVDMSSAESLRVNVDLLQPKHYIFPLIAHAVGTYTGALMGYKVAKDYSAVVAYCIGFLFFLGGISAALTIPAPLDFILIDLIFAYIPMAYAAVKTLQPHHVNYDD